MSDLTASSSASASNLDSDSISSATRAPADLSALAYGVAYGPAKMSVILCTGESPGMLSCYLFMCPGLELTIASSIYSGL